MTVNEELAERVLDTKLYLSNFSDTTFPRVFYRGHSASLLSWGRIKSLITIHNAVVPKCFWVDNEEIVT